MLNYSVHCRDNTVQVLILEGMQHVLVSDNPVIVRISSRKQLVLFIGSIALMVDA